LRRALLRDNTVINLSRQQTQRQANHPGTMREHPLNGIMGLAGVCRAENGFEDGVVKRGHRAGTFQGTL